MKIYANVFGKQGCKKCEMLKRRLSALLEKPEYAGIEMRYHDVLSLDGIVDFCKADCLNPNRIPALLMSVERDGKERYLPGPLHGRECYEESAVCGHLGMQTDYNNGGGVIPPAAIQDVLERALAAL